jgi:hypothetical protein
LAGTVSSLARAYQENGSGLQKLQMLSRSGLLTFRLPLFWWTKRNDLSRALFQFGHRAVEVESESVTANAEQHA